MPRWRSHADATQDRSIRRWRSGVSWPHHPFRGATDDPNPHPSRGQGQAIDLVDKIGRIDGYWQPRVVAETNDYQFKVVKVEGEFQWHRHADTDETFIVLDGELHIDVRDADTIVLRSGQMAVVPKNVEHRPRATAEVKLLLIEPRGVRNTGDGPPGERTVANDQWA